MDTQLPYLFWGYTAGWLIIFGYLLLIGQREKSLRRKIAELQEAIEERWKKK